MEEKRKKVRIKFQADFDKERGIPLRQGQVIEEYLKDFNFLNALKRMGYPEDNILSIAQSYRNNPRFMALLRKRRDEVKKKTDINAANILNEYARIAFSNIDEFLEMKEIEKKVGKNIVKKRVLGLKDFDFIPSESKRTISQINFDGDQLKSIKMHSKIDALNALSKNLGLFEKDNEIKLNIHFEQFIQSLPEQIREKVLKKIEEKING